MISNIIFGLLFILAVVLFVRSIRYIAHNIRMGKPVNRNDNKADRWKLMARVAIGQSKMTSRPLSAVLHLFVYVGFIVIYTVYLFHDYSFNMNGV